MKTITDVDVAWAKADAAVLNACEVAEEVLRNGENLSSEDKQFLREIISLCNKIVDLIENGE
ncbi:MAG: hypothetical protein IJS28_06895 [Synergistaceae bacterium]|nr:hypothetical protein [Synergistaceae bacterium]